MLHAAYCIEFDMLPKFGPQFNLKYNVLILIRIEASPMLRLVNMDVTNEDHVRHALDYVAENLPAGQQGKKQYIFILPFNT